MNAPLRIDTATPASLPDLWQAHRDGPYLRQAAATIAAECRPWIRFGRSSITADMVRVADELLMTDDSDEVAVLKVEMDTLFKLSAEEEAAEHIASMAARRVPDGFDVMKEMAA